MRRDRSRMEKDRELTFPALIEMFFQNREISSTFVTFIVVCKACIH